MAVEIISIIIAVVSLIGSLVAAGFTGWISFYLDQVKRRNESRALIHKYQDPLMLAAYDLQSRLVGIVHPKVNLLRYGVQESKKDLIYVYTAFLVGQYFSWVYILRRQAQFLRFSTEKQTKQLNKILDEVTNRFSKDVKGEEPFMLWRGQQMAIGELMTLSQENQLYCMGFGAFAKRYHTEPDFKKWFDPIETGINDLVQAQSHGNITANYRLRRLQHLLIDLVLLLDKDYDTGLYENPKVVGAPACNCDKCPVEKKESGKLGNEPEP